MVQELIARLVAAPFEARGHLHDVAKPPRELGALTFGQRLRQLQLAWTSCFAPGT